MKTDAVDLAVTGRLVLPDGVRDGTLVIHDGRIDRVLGPTEAVPPAREVRNVGRAHILPGLIDSHVHFRTPGLTHKETWEAGSRAAVAGGVTTVIDMPNTIPHYADVRALPDRIARVTGRSLVDFAFHLGVTGDTIDALNGVDPRVVPSVKVFLATHHTAHHLIHEDAELGRLFRVAARNDLLLTLHAEDQATLDRLTACLGEPHSLTEHELVCARSAAVAAVSRVIRHVERYGTNAHVLHVSSADEVDMLEAAKRAGLPITFEVTAHHLTFTAADEQLGAFGKLRPALRSGHDRERLWQSVVDGSVATLGSDHAPHTRAEKSVPFAAAPPGFPGVQELGSAFLTGLRRFAPSLGRDRHAQLLARLAAETPARLFGLDQQKGALAAGRDADLVVLDLERPWRVGPASLHAQCGWSAYEGRVLFGLPLLTVRRGRVVSEDGVFGPTDGTFLRSHRTRWVNRCQETACVSGSEVP